MIKRANAFRFGIFSKSIGSNLIRAGPLHYNHICYQHMYADFEERILEFIKVNVHKKILSSIVDRYAKDLWEIQVGYHTTLIEQLH